MVQTNPHRARRETHRDAENRRVDAGKERVGRVERGAPSHARHPV